MDLTSEIKVITHGIDATGVNIDISHTTFIKDLYPTYSHYLESLQASGQMKSLNFDNIVGKIAKHDEGFGKKATQSNVETIFLAQKEKKRTDDSSR